MADQFCKFCYYHNLDGQGGCVAKETRIHPHVWEKCAYKPSMWKPKTEPEGGRKVVGYSTDPSPKEGRTFTRQEEIEHDGLSFVVFGDRKAYVDPEGNAYSADEERRPLGKIEDLQFEARLAEYGFTKETASAELIELLKEKKID